MDEIAENEFNLNIPRYVDMYEAEEQIDVVAERKALVELNKKTEADLAKVSEFLSELGL